MQLTIDKSYLIEIKKYMTVKIIKTPLILISSGEDYVFRNPPKKPRKKVV